jgi:rare lipoprotein A (peptidoglycan hydrolase)
MTCVAKGTFSNSLCGKQVKITNTQNKKTVTATIADECPGCKNAESIDLSQGAFDKIASAAQGEVSSEYIFLSACLRNY